MCFIHAYIVHTNLHHTKDIFCFHFISYPNHLYEYRVGSFPNSSVFSSPMALCWPLLASSTPRFSRWEGSRRRVSFRCPWRAQVEKGWPQPPKWRGSVENQWNHRNLIEYISSSSHNLPAAMAKQTNKAPIETRMDDPFLGNRWCETSPSCLDTKSMVCGTQNPPCWQSDPLSNESWFWETTTWRYQVIIERKMSETHPFLIQNFYIIPSIHLLNAETLDRLWWLKTIIYYTAPFCGSVSWSYQTWRVFHPAAAGHHTLPWVGCMDQPRVKLYGHGGGACAGAGAAAVMVVVVRRKWW